MRCIEKALSQIQEQVDYINGLKPAAEVAERCFEKFGDEDDGDYLSIGFGSGQLNGVLLMLHYDRVDQVVPILKWLAKEGFHSKGKPEDYPEIHRRRWDLGDIQLAVFFPWDDAATCKFVEVGKKEVPIYELKCE